MFVFYFQDKNYRILLIFKFKIGKDRPQKNKNASHI